MKIWKFYKKPANNDDTTQRSLSDKYPLYALTNDKKKMKKFLELRDEDKFIILTDNIDSEDYTLLANTHRSTVLDFYRLTTVKKNKIIKIDLVMTSLEYNETVESGISLLDAFVNWTSIDTPKIVKTKYFNILNDIGYVDIYDMYNDRELDMGSYSTPYIRFDELNIFLHLYEEMIK